MFQNLGRDMAYSDTLKVRCPCEREAVFSCKEAFAIFGDDATPYDIRRRLRCSGCGEVGKVDVWI
ncbi:hypothetical protein M9M90_15755 [Phenylobacterium sp. LH3H17]|uniref:hypothetical protein n=1 Tax=Phenylobacterium sp. LH3H17 TaxID=2903901 RepID=UPI0020C9E3BA|nr:hypothetical protein [Phenylobacterium sp. LH3H17]UTP38666.1 hypothetical protein M9M90_15755 [Phenylobacterium sp. LH3H17]